jgi:hypothetical protein
MTKTSIPRNEKALEELRNRIKSAAGFNNKALSPHDFKELQLSIRVKVQNSSITDKTLKRFFGYDRTNDNSLVRLYTLDVLSQYVGFENWNAFLEHFKLLSGEGSGDFTGDKICSNDLNIGEIIHIEWNPNRKSLLKYLGNLSFEIIETENSKWQVGDTFSCKHFILGKPLYVDNLTGKNGILKSKMFVVGGKGGLTVVMHVIS